MAELLKKINPLAPDDTLIFIGDYIDRGTNSKGVIDIVLQLRAEHDRVITLMGNHELMLLDAIRGYGQNEYLSMGGAATLKSYGIQPESINDLDGLLPPYHLRISAEFTAILGR